MLSLQWNVPKEEQQSWKQHLIKCRADEHAKELEKETLFDSMDYDCDDCDPDLDLDDASEE